jgi:hypothetical protein
MENEKIFTEGLIFKMPRENAPAFVKGSLSIKVEDFAKFMQKHQKNGWLNIDLKVSQGAKAYAELNTWQPNSNTPKAAPSTEQAPPPTEEGGGMNIDDIEF